MNGNSTASRPVFPPLFLVAMPLWACCAATYSLLEGMLASVALAFAVVGACGVLMCAVCMYRCGTQRLLLVGLGVFLGLACAGQEAFSMYGKARYFADAGVQTYLFQIVEDVQESQFGVYCMARAQDRSGHSCLVRVNLPNKSSAQCWDVFEKTCSIRLPSRVAASYYWNKGCLGSVSPYHADLRAPKGPMGIVSMFREKGLQAFGAQAGDGALFMRSIVFGQRGDLFDSDLYGNVKRIGLSHLVAVSGAHVSIMLCALGWLLKRLRCPRAPSLCLQAFMCVLYVLLTAAPFSAIRASIMVLCGLFSYAGARRSHALNALSVCAIGFIVLRPSVCLSTSFLLSSLATAGIVLFAGYFSSWFGVLLRGRLPNACELLGMTCAALFATLPVSVAQFGQLSLIAPLANLAAAPLFAFLCVGGMGAGLAGALLPAAGIPAALMCAFAEYFCRGVALLASVPYAAVAFDAPWWMACIVAGGAAAWLYVRWPKPSVRSFTRFFAAGLVAFACLLFAAPMTHGTEIIMLDVGQGDAFVLRSGHRAVLIDTGNKDTSVLKGLARYGVYHVDAVLISHPDDDHCGSLSAILDFIEVDHVLVAQDLLSCTCANCRSLKESAKDVQLVGVQKGDIFVWGAFRAKVLSPSSFVDEGGNDDSLVLRVEVDADANGIADSTGLFCGDAESEVLGHLALEGTLAQVDIYKVGHHGSLGAFTNEQLALLSPRIALVSAGRGNRYGHPAQDTMQLLEEAGVVAYRTDEQGDVVCKLDGERIEVICHSVE